MKIRKTFSSDYSAKLRIIGTFKTARDAQRAANLFNELIAVGDKTNGGNIYFSNELMEVFNKFNFHGFSKHDPETLDLFYELRPDKNIIVVETDETDIQALLKVFIYHRARVELYSRHDYAD